MRQGGRIVVAVLFVLWVGFAGMPEAFHVLGQGPGTELYTEARGAVISSVLLLVLGALYALVQRSGSGGRRRGGIANLVGVAALVVGVWWFFVNLALTLAR